MKVAILEDYQRAAPALACYAKLAAHQVEVFSDSMKDEAKLAERLSRFDAAVLIRERTRITKSLLDRVQNLKLLVQTAKVGPHVDVKACQARGITVCDGTGGPVSTAELTWGLILAAARNIVAENNRVREGKWQGSVGFQLAGKKLALIGFGRIAQLVARYAAAFDVKVGVWGRATTIERARAAGLPIFESMEKAFEESDIVSLHLRLNPETRGLIKCEHLSRMHPQSLFVNTSRAELVASGDLERALKEGRPGQAALDVFENEPIMAPNHPLAALPNVTATPHIGFVERGNYEKYFGDAFDAINAFAAGKPVRVVA